MLPKNNDEELSRRMATIEKELAALATAMGTVYELMSDIQVETKKERETNYQELRTWAQSNNSLLMMISSAINAIDALKQKLGFPSRPLWTILLIKHNCRACSRPK